MTKQSVINNLRIIPREDDFLDRKLGSRGEIFFDRDNNTLRLYDGATTGGISLAKADLTNIAVGSFRAKSVESRLATVIYTVTITGPQGGDIGNKYNLNGVYRPTPNFVVGYTYVFVQNDQTNVYFPNATGTTPNPHPLNFSADNLSGERGGGTSYLSNVQYFLDGKSVTQAVYNSTAFNTATSRQVWITVTNSTPSTLYYWCWNHTAMGNSIAVADPGSGTGSGSSLEAGVGIIITEADGISTITNSGIVTLSAGSGITIDDDSTEKIITNTGVLGIVAGSGITTSVNQGIVTINSVATTGNVTFNGRTVDSDDSTAITFTPSVVFDSDVTVYEIVFPDGSRQVSAAGPTPGPQGPQGAQGPQGPTGSGAGDVSSLATPTTDNAIVRYHEATGTIIQNSTAILGDNGVITATGFVGNLDAANLSSGTIPDARFPATLPTASGVNLTALNAANLGSGTVPDARFPATLPAASGVNLTSLNATNLASGTVPVNRLGTAGTRDATTFLRGDNTWAAVAGGGGASDSFSTIAVAGQSSVVADSSTDTLTLVAGTGITITTDASTDSITITNSGSAANSFSTVAVAGQNNVVADSSTDTLTLVAGTGITITTDASTDSITITNSGSAANTFSTVAVAGQNNVVADSSTDTLTLAAGTGISITTNDGTDTVTITSTVSAGATAFTGLSDVTSASLTVDRIYLPAITMLSVTNNGASAYRFDQYGSSDNPTIYAINGTTIAFNLNIGGHPFLIQNGAGVNYDTGLVHVTTAGVVTTGASAQGKTSGTLYWKIPDSISGGYRYQCSVHGAMVGSITIKNFVSI